MVIDDEIKTKIRIGLEIIAECTGSHNELGLIASKLRDKGFNNKDGAFLLLLLERCGVIERKNREPEDFARKEYKDFFDKIHYFDYKVTSAWLNMRYPKERFERLVKIISYFYRNDWIIDKSPIIGVI